MRQWNVVCQTAEGVYSLRLNARTGQVYGINRVDLPPEPTHYSPENSGLLSKNAAKVFALRYVHLVGGTGNAPLRYVDGSGNLAEFRQYQLVASVHYFPHCLNSAYLLSFFFFEQIITPLAI